MIELTMHEKISVSGGVMTCYCKTFGATILKEGEYVRDDGGDKFVETCETRCCGWSLPLYKGWKYNGTDIEYYTIEQPFEIKQRPMAKEGDC